MIRFRKILRSIDFFSGRPELIHFFDTLILFHLNHHIVPALLGTYT